MQLRGSTPGDCGSMAAPTKCAGNSCATRWHSSLQMAAQVALVSKLPMWCAMKLARGEKMVRSLPRSRILCSWLCSMDSRSSSSLMRSDAAEGASAGLPRLAIWRLRQVSSAAGAVV
jgi:hypothetical protein